MAGGRTRARSLAHKHAVIHWLVQSTTAHPDLAAGRVPPGLLNPDEEARFQALKTEKRRREWLLGRWTAKRLLQAVMRQTTGQTPPLDALVIENNAAGAPYAIYCTGEATGNGDSEFKPTPPPVASPLHLPLSISHSGDHAFCAVLVRNEELPDVAATDGQRISGWPDDLFVYLPVSHTSLGADIERIEGRPAAFADDYFTAAEMERIEHTPPCLRPALVTAVWSAKEAVLKALQVGLRVDTRAVSCLVGPAADLPATWRPFTIQWNGEMAPAADLVGWWRGVEGYVLTLAVRSDE
ncbi:MAG: 4'-phosphopantetheinyl transferase superfamily protein [Chloroflexota bacterium]